MHPHNVLAYEDETDSVFQNVGISNSDARNYPEEDIQRTEHGESLKSRMQDLSFDVDLFISTALTRSRFSLDRCRYQ
jgi:hypothetical protein